MRPTAILLSAALTVMAAIPATAFIAENGLVVDRDRDGFTVPWSGLSGAPAFWCAAGDYVIRGLNRPTSTKIYRYSAPIRRAGQGVSFGFDRARGTATGLVRLYGDNSLSAAYARRFCDLAQAN